MPKEYSIEIQFENLLFGQFAFNLDCQQDFIEFANECSVQREEIVPRDLHGERAAPTDLLSGD